MSPQEFARSAAAKRELPWEEEKLDGLLLSAAILHETNRQRAENKLAALVHMPRLDEASLMHARDMSDGTYFSHENPNDPKKRTVLERVKLLELNPMFVAENIIMEYGIRYQVRRKIYDVTKSGKRGISYEPNGPLIRPRTYHEFAKQVCQRWMDSPAHRETMLSPRATHLGSAACPGRTDDEIRFRKFYAVQVFFTPMPGE